MPELAGIEHALCMWLLEVAGQQPPRRAGAGCMEKSGCSPFPMCWAKGTPTFYLYVFVCI